MYNEKLEVQDVIQWLVQFQQDYKCEWDKSEIPTLHVTIGDKSEQVILDGSGLLYTSYDRDIEDSLLETDFNFSFRDGILRGSMYFPTRGHYVSLRIHNHKMFEDFAGRIFDSLHEEIDCKLKGVEV